ncbi:MAG: hypothetical protein WD208_11410 [Dehalococcoidia bacterium]
MSNTIRDVRNIGLVLLPAALVAILMFMAPAARLSAATVAPEEVTFGADSEICTEGSHEFQVEIALPESAVTGQVDVFFLSDDTGSFAAFASDLAALFGPVVEALETDLPEVDFGFGVGRFEDYGGPGTGFSLEDETGRPFILNQPIITVEDAGGESERDDFITDAFGREAPGFGGDIPETALEALHQAATGTGFDADGDGDTLGSGPAGDPDTQTEPGTSGDVPAFDSNVAPASGDVGGAGWRSGSVRIVVLATDAGTVAAFPDADSTGDTITGVDGSSEPSSVFNSLGRFGPVSDEKSADDNTVMDAVAPEGSATVQETIDALNSLGIRVIGMAPSGAPTSEEGPSFDPSVLLSALGRLTGAVDDSDTPLVFDTSADPGDLAAAIAGAITTTAAEPVDVTLDAMDLPDGLTFEFEPEEESDVAPGESATFNVTLTSDGSPESGTFNIRFLDANSGAVLGMIPVTVDCDVTEPTPEPGTPTPEPTETPTPEPGTPTPTPPEEPEPELPVCNEAITFVPVGSTQMTDLSPVTGGPAGTFSFTARMTNTSSADLEDIVTPIETLTNDNLVLNADGGPSAEGGQVTVPEVGDYTDGVLSPGETVEVDYLVGLAEVSPFDFFVDATCSVNEPENDVE